MKKMFGKKLAFLLAACVLTAGVFVACKNGEDSEESEASSLASPVGADPFKTGTYTRNDSQYRYDIDTSKRTITTHYREENALGEETKQIKYTYDDKKQIVTWALYKSAIPADIDAYISTYVNNTKYTNGWKLAEKTEFTAAVKKFNSARIVKIEEQLKDTTLSDSERENLLKKLDDCKTIIAKAGEEFEEPVTYSYSINSNVITLTNETAENDANDDGTVDKEQLVLTLIN